MKSRLVWLLLLMVLVSGCATPVYKQVFKEKTSYNSKDYFVSKDIIHQATMKVICAKNFIIEEDDKGKGFILAKRSFRKGKRTTILAVQAKIIPSQMNKATLYLNAVEMTERLYVADRTRFLLFVIPLPGGGGKNASKIKEGENTILDKKFYQSFFEAIDKEINFFKLNQSVEHEPEEKNSSEAESQLSSESIEITEEEAITGDDY